MLTYLIGTAINNTFTINSDIASSLFVKCVKIMVTCKLLDMDATLLANAYLFATNRVNRFEISAKMSLVNLAEFDGLNNDNIKNALYYTSIIGIPIMSLVLFANTTNTNAIVPI